MWKERKKEGWVDRRKKKEVYIKGGRRDGRKVKERGEEGGGNE